MFYHCMGSVLSVRFQMPYGDTSCIMFHVLPNDYFRMERSLWQKIIDTWVKYSSDPEIIKIFRRDISSEIQEVLAAICNEINIIAKIGYSQGKVAVNCFDDSQERFEVTNEVLAYNPPIAESNDGYVYLIPCASAYHQPNDTVH